MQCLYALMITLAKIVVYHETMKTIMYSTEIAQQSISCLRFYHTTLKASLNQRSIGLERFQLCTSYISEARQTAISYHRAVQAIASHG